MLELLVLAAAIVAYWLGTAYCDQTENRDGSYGSWPFKNRGRNGRASDRSSARDPSRGGRNEST